MKIYAKLALALLALAALPGLALAAAGEAEPWQIGFQDSVTPVADYIHWFHNWILLPVSVIIALFVLALLLIVIVKFNAKANPVPSKTTHHAGLEVAWTVIPVLILVLIAIPSFRLLYLQRDIPQADMTIKVIGNPGWNWTYQYPDLGVDESGEAKVSFTASLLPEDQAKAQNRPYLLATDVPVVVPVNKTIKVIVTSDPAGIIHAWTIPSFGNKIDAIPGRLNEDWFRASKEGVYYGQCSELCGKDHAFMPVELHVVSEEDFKAWSEKVQTASVEEARDFLFAMLQAKGQLASN
ncbi:cytochrome c oxidase subunit II [Aestuariivirga sp.]|uniref:cytochrome c oxidase subunit II n=1 Tax=Aestuariivirga sp. TaxID=2650926 RepID=UPI0039E6F57B